MLGTPVVGDFEALTQLRDNLQDLADNWSPRLAAVLAKVSIELTEESFVSQRDPYGIPWEPSKRALGIKLRRIRTGQYALQSGVSIGLGLTLIDSGRLLFSLREEHGRDSFSIVSDTPYANIHQYGGPIGGFLRGKGIEMPVRSFVPRPGEGLGPIWSPAWEDATASLFGEMMSRQR